jgi:hypothetical protein
MNKQAPLITDELENETPFFVGLQNAGPAH